MISLAIEQVKVVFEKDYGNRKIVIGQSSKLIKYEGVVKEKWGFRLVS
jgi:hypothetical protein